MTYKQPTGTLCSSCICSCVDAVA